MATPPSSSSPGSTPAGSTRQLLDELDALMQRMLALPVEQDEQTAAEGGRGGAPPADPPGATLPAPPGASPADNREPPRPARESHPLTPDPPARVQGPHRVALHQAELAPAGVPPKAAAPVQAREMDADLGDLTPVGPEIFSTLTAAPPFRPRPVPPPPRPVRRRPALTRGLVLRPLYWTNRAFDRGTDWLGGPGRWLRGPRGRAVLGWVGVLLLALALGWQVLAWLGWGW
jgi:hypothetical protein